MSLTVYQIMNTPPTNAEIRSTIDREILASLEEDEDSVFIRRKPKRASTWFSSWWGKSELEELDTKSSSEEEKQEQIAAEEERDMYRGMGYQYVFNLII